MSDDYDENIEYMFGVMDERERIIKLLEDNQLLKETKLKKWLFAQGFRFAIALIKGENK